MLVQQRRGSKRPKRTDFFTGGKELTKIYANERRNLRNFRKRTTNGEERKLLLRAERERRRIRAVCPPAAYNRGVCALPDPKAYRKRRYNGPTRSDPASSLLRTRAGRRRLTGQLRRIGVMCAFLRTAWDRSGGVCKEAEGTAEGLDEEAGRHAFLPVRIRAPMRRRIGVALFGPEGKKWEAAIRRPPDASGMLIWNDRRRRRSRRC